MQFIKYLFVLARYELTFEIDLIDHDHVDGFKDEKINI